jgi:hypothetical protein
MYSQEAATKNSRTRTRWESAEGQSLVEFALCLPLLLLLVLGIIEVSYALYDQHILTKLAREGSNLISRDTTLDAAATAMSQIASNPVNFSTANSRLIFSVIRQGMAGSNAGRPILYQRHQIGGLSASSLLQTRGAGTFGGAPNYLANNPDNDTNLQITNLPANITLPNNGFIFLTEVHNQHNLITPFDNFGFRLPTTLSASAYF